MMKKSQIAGNPAEAALDRHLKPRAEVSLSLFSFLFSEIVQSLMKQEGKEKEADLEQSLAQLGFPVGEKVLELLFFREKGGSSGACNNGRRETKIVNMLHFINNNVWKTLFGKVADGLEQSIEDADEYRILDKNPITNKFTSTGKGSHINCAAYIAGILEGYLCAAKMDAKVTAHTVREEGEAESAATTIYVIKFTEEASKRDEKIS